MLLNASGRTLLPGDFISGNIVFYGCAPDKEVELSLTNEQIDLIQSLIPDPTKRL
jgi:hypothetical protein